MTCCCYCLTVIIEILGWIGLFRLCFELYNFAYQRFFAKDRKGLELRNKYGEDSWAIITGSTSGIGLGFAKYLASKGFNLVCISRNPEKLKEKEAEIKAEAKGEIKIKNITKDFTQAYQADFYNDIAETVKDLDISILVNNVGIFHDEELNILPQTY